MLSGTADADELILLVDTKRAIEGKTFGLVTVGDDAVWYKDQQIQGYLSRSCWRCSQMVSTSSHGPCCSTTS